MGNFNNVIIENYNIIWGLVEAVIFFAINGFKLAITPFSLIMASIFALCVMAYKIISLKIVKKGGISLYTMFLMTGKTILFSLIANKVIFKETATKKMVMAVILCIIGLLLFL